MPNTQQARATPVLFLNSGFQVSQKATVRNMPFLPYLLSGLSGLTPALKCRPQSYPSGELRCCSRFQSSCCGLSRARGHAARDKDPKWGARSIAISLLTHNQPFGCPGGMLLGCDYWKRLPFPPGSHTRSSSP